ncbi:MAG TPA: FAD-dependent oxidoreductase [Nocardioides sp.]|nr:FAD-dependent oxidoreductase [Nocardioides sp.]
MTRDTAAGPAGDMGDAARSGDGEHVVVVGAGIIGAAVARDLAASGRRVTVLDTSPGTGSTAGNAGLVVPSYATPMSTPENLLAGLRSLGRPSAPLTFALPLGPATVGWLLRFVLACRPARVRRDTAELHRLARWSHDAYHAMQRDGLDLGLRRAGWLWASSVEPPDGLRRTAERLRRAGATCEVLDAPGARALEPGLGDVVTSGLWFPEESVLDPGRASAALLADAVARGARLRTEKVVGVERRGRRVHAVRTDHGVIEAERFVLATGARVRGTARLFGLRVPVQPGYGWSVTLGGGRDVVQHALMDLERHVVISPMGDQVRITGGMEFGGRPGSPPRSAALEHLREAGFTLVPGLRRLEQVDAWRGARPMTPSGLPVVGRRRGAPNVVVAAGHGPLGITLAPSTARRVVEVLDEIADASPATATR